MSAISVACRILTISCREHTWAGPACPHSFEVPGPAATGA
jgi:hypothetical protein